MRLQAFRANATSALSPVDPLYRNAGSKPTLDQRFAKDKSLVDKVSGDNLITFSRASSGTYVDSDGLVKTASTDEARFDHDPVTGESLGLLIEESRTNLLQFSQVLDNALWTNLDATSALASGINAPDGTASAYVVTSSAANGIIRQDVDSISSNSAHTWSCFIKKKTSSEVTINPVLVGGTAYLSNLRYNFDTDTLTLISDDYGNSLFGREIFPNGWLRIHVTVTDQGSNTSARIYIRPSSTEASDMYAWGAQLEAGTFPTSYIPTSGSSATRAADIATIDGTNFSPWYNQSSGTFVTTSSSVTNLESSDIRGIFNVTDIGTTANTFRHYLLYRGGGSDDFSIASRLNNVNAFSPNTTGDPTYSNDTIAYGYSSSEISKIFYDGSLLTSSASVLDWTTYTANRLIIGGNVKLNGHISRLTYFPTQRTDQELINVTGGDTAIPIITYGITSTGGDFTLRSTGTVDYAVDWDSSGGYQESTSNELINTYAAGNYDLVVYSDDAYSPFFNNVNADVDQITSVVIGAGANLGANLNNGWSGGNNITSFECPFEVTSNVTNLNNAWRFLNSLTSFPLIDTSSCVAFSNTWSGCKGLTSFPLIQTSSGLSFAGSWNNSNILVSFPQLNFSSATRCKSAWKTCAVLANFPANMFDTTGTLTTDAFDLAWQDCALTAQSIENILVSLDTNGQSNIALGVDGGTNAAKTTWSTAANTAYDNLIAKGWTISFNA